MVTFTFAAAVLIIISAAAAAAAAAPDRSSAGFRTFSIVTWKVNRNLSFCGCQTDNRLSILC